VVGAECTTDAQCGASLRCITSGSSELTGGGPAAGYCTRACTADAECQALDTRSVCGSTGGVSVCLRGCLSGEPTPTENKCLNRSTLVCDAPPRTLGEREPGVCVPQCASDVDCPGRACDLASGLCSDRASSGLAIGAPCTSDSQCAARDCQGVCTARCSAGRQNNGCGFGIRASLRAAACVLAPSGSFGDVGLCLEVCDVDADCTEPAATCSPGVFNTGRSGFCAPPSGSAQ
jgi:hypothetical protein